MIANDNIPPAKAGPDDKKSRPCPLCGKPRDKRYEPFCSRRCADVDLHRWLKGSYVIPGDLAKSEPSDEDD